ncbi:hypothetical protein K458DRAFT_390581 [Lentithecium fluviatile CBS 122367]|uniref:Heterokaryon incompatibility domain-containing protein n=1 Tax=Lentithecium fluviatile CBS 122367 TaxID=1168545 RepID=A0A6G1IXJ3_9PLEO|nr:hypothetical protein K458DRAFT_390581 [Lentithecium fluviatile CBS 122367]
MSPFYYEPLKSSRAIRLLKFLPGPKPICQMVTVEVEKAPLYTALSYTWGCKDLVRAITVNGSTADECDLAFDVMKQWKARLDALKEQCGGSDELAVASISSDDPNVFGPTGSREERAF